MKKSELIKIIKEAVRSELNEALPSILSKTLEEQKVTSNQVSDPVALTHDVLRKKRPTKKLKNFSKNEALNKVLNETVGGIPTEGPRVGESQQMTDLQGKTVSIEELPDHVSNALTRNYSDVMKLVDKKRGKV